MQVVMMERGGACAYIYDTFCYAGCLLEGGNVLLYVGDYGQGMIRSL